MPYYKNYQNLPKKPVKTFHDLDVYQRALEMNVFVVNILAFSFYSQMAKIKNKKAKNATGGAVDETKEMIIKIMINCACSLPHLIAEAHSFRFGSQKECLILLEKAMLNCNKMVVYLDQARDICATGIATEQFNELEEKYFYLRRKILNLQRAWQKYMRPVAERPAADIARY